jgi:hypothetical protein
LLKIDILDPLHLEGIDGGMDEEITQASLLGAWKDQDRMRIELLGGQHGSQRIKIGIDMGGDDFHNKTELRVMSYKFKGFGF